MMNDDLAFTAGLMSVTFRDSEIHEIVDLACRAGLESISWAGDAHVPTGDLDQANRARAACAAAGIRIESFGSYWKAIDSTFTPVLETARALGAGRIRVWTGKTGSRAIDSAARQAITRRLADAADEAADLGIGLHLEFHPHTLTDSAPSTRALLDEIAELRTDARLPVATYWQPRPGITVPEAIGEIAFLGSRISSLHVFSWDANGSRLALKEHREAWLQYLKTLMRHPPTAPFEQRRELLLEFVRSDSRQQLLDDASELRRWIELISRVAP